jgi:hypothetical protein
LDGLIRRIRFSFRRLALEVIDFFSIFSMLLHANHGVGCKRGWTAFFSGKAGFPIVLLPEPDICMRLLQRQEPCGSQAVETGTKLPASSSYVFLAKR